MAWGRCLFTYPERYNRYGFFSVVLNLLLTLHFLQISQKINSK
jgi:hypothetical protein